MKNQKLIRSCLAVVALALSARADAWARESFSAAKEEQMFQTASQLYQENVMDKAAAVEAYQRFAQDFRNSPRAADAVFMLGESYLDQALGILKAERASKKNADARGMSPNNSAAIDALNNAQNAFRDVVDHYRKSGLHSSAQYRLGEIAYDRKDWSGAVDEFRRVDKNYSKSYLVPESWMGIIYSDIALEQYGQAEANLFLLGETYPNYLKVPAVLYAQGIVSLHKGDYAGAEKALTQVRSDEAQFYLGKTYLLSKRPFLAATAFERLVRDYPDSELKEDSDFFIGDSFFLAEDYDGAITKYQRFLDRYPNSRLKVAAIYRIGSAYFQKKDYVNARANYQAILDRYPQDFFAPLSQYFIAESYLIANQIREALFAYTKVITQFPDTNRISPLAHYKLAWTQFQVGDYAQAIQTCQNFLALYPTHLLAKNVYLIAGNAFLQLKRYSEAVTSWQRIIDLAPTSEIAEQALFSILQAQYVMKNYDSILTSYQFIFRHLPPSQSKWRSLSYLYAADAYLAMNRVEEAQAIYEMALKVYPNDLSAFYAQDGLAWCYSYKGEDERALEERKKLKDMLSVAQSTFVFTGRNELGIADSMFNQKNYEDAYQLYEKFVSENPQDSASAAALFRAGMSLYYLRYYTQAVETWRKLQATYPKAPESQQAAGQMADTLFRAQKYSEAVAAYRAVIDKYPMSPQLSQAYLRIAQSEFNGREDAAAVADATALINRSPAAAEATDALDLLEAAFDRSPKADFESVLGGIVKAHPHTAIAGDAQFRLARRLYDRKNYAKAAEQFQAFSVDFTDNPQLPKAQFMLAESLFQAGKYEEAVPAFQRFLDNFPRSDDTALALFHMASSHYNMKKYDPAANYYQRLLEEYPASEYAKAAQFNLALSFKALGKLESAQEAYAKYARLVGPGDPTGQSALWELLAVQKDRRDFNGALETLGKIQAGVVPGSDGALEAAYRAGEIYLLMNRPDEAANNWQKLKDMRPSGNAFRLEGLIKLGEMYEKTDPSRAVVIYEDLAKNAKGQVAQAARERVRMLRSVSGGEPKPAKRKSSAPSKKAAEDSGTQVMPQDEPAPAPSGDSGVAEPAGQTSAGGDNATN